MPYNPSQYHRRSIRLQGYDYAQAGVYFVTICAQNRECLFGEIVDAEIHPNLLGEVIVKWWHELSCYYPPVQLAEFVVMPNHIHGIIIISNETDAKDGEAEGTVGTASSKTRAGTEGGAASRRPYGRRTLGQLVGYFKFGATKEINQIRGAGNDRVLQRGYYEHIIRNEHEWEVVANYIRANPANWCSDIDNPTNLAKRLSLDVCDDYWRAAGL